MKRCLACNGYYGSADTLCPDCGFQPVLMEGFLSYAPGLAHGGGGFKAGYFSELAGLEESNFWFRSRNQLIVWALKEHCPHFRRLLEIGCGTGYVLSGIAEHFPHAVLHGSEIFVAGLGFAAARRPLIDYFQMDARDIPFQEEFDVIGAFDVLEHVREDERVLVQANAALKSEGFLLITVPQHKWLWSPADEYALHVRRYPASELHRKIEHAGFRIVRSTSFVTTLLPAMMISRFFQRKGFGGEFDATSELKIPRWLNELFFQLLALEVAAINNGVNFPAGGSRFVVAKKI